MTLRARRAAFAARAGITVALAAAACASLTWAADGRPARLDLSRGRERTPGPRLLRALDSLDGPARVTIVAPSGTIGPRERRRVEDMLDLVRRAGAGASGARVSTAWLDPARGSDGEKYDEMVAGWAAARDADFARARLAIARALEEFASLARALPGERAGQALEAAGRAHAAAEHRAAGVSIPAPDAALEALAPALGAMRAEWSREAGAPREGRRELLEGAARVEETLRQAGRSESDALRAARALTAGPAMVVEARGRVRAAPLSALFLPAREAGGEAEFVGQEALATALGGEDAGGPIVALVHAGSAALLDDASSGMGAPASPEAREFVGRLSERLRVRGARLVEWAVSERKERPRFPAPDAKDAGPVVWVVLAPAAVSAGSGAAARALAEAVGPLLNEGENALLSLEPSALPGLGEPDPLAALLQPWGIEARTARVIMERAVSTRAAAVTTEFRVLGATGADASGEPDEPGRVVAHGAAGLPLSLSWASELLLRRADAGSARVTPLVTIEDTGSRWAESQWVSYRQTPPAMRARLTQQPSPTPELDALAPANGGEWVVAAAAERPAPEGRGAQRVVVVSASGWFLDPVAEATDVVDGRAVARNPGNAALFDAAVAWLAGREEAVGPPPRGMEPRIPAMSARTLAGARWAAALGPAGLLLLGAGAARRVRR